MQIVDGVAIQWHLRSMAVAMEGRFGACAKCEMWRGFDALRREARDESKMRLGALHEAGG